MENSSFTDLVFFDEVQQLLGRNIDTVTVFFIKSQVGVNFSDEAAAVAQCDKHLVNQRLTNLLLLHRSKRVRKVGCGNTDLLCRSLGHTFSLLAGCLRILKSIKTMQPQLIIIVICIGK